MSKDEHEKTLNKQAEDYLLKIGEMSERIADIQYELNQYKKPVVLLAG